MTVFILFLHAFIFTRKFWACSMMCHPAFLVLMKSSTKFWQNSCSLGCFLRAFNFTLAGCNSVFKEGKCCFEHNIFILMIYDSSIVNVSLQHTRKVLQPLMCKWVYTLQELEWEQQRYFWKVSMQELASVIRRSCDVSYVEQQDLCGDQQNKL